MLKQMHLQQTNRPLDVVQVCNWWQIQDGPNYDDNSVLDEDERPEDAVNADFIANAREDIQALLDHIDRLRAESSRLKAANGHLEQEVRVMRARELA